MRKDPQDQQPLRVGPDLVEGHQAADDEAVRKPGRFELTGEQHFAVKAGEWFAPAAVVVYVRQPHRQTAALSEEVKLDATQTGRLVLSLASSGGRSTIECDFRSFGD